MRRPSAPTILAATALAVASIGVAPQAQALVSRAALADNARRLQGRTLAQVRTGGDAARLAGHSYREVRSGIDAETLGGIEPDRFVQGIGKLFAGSLHARDGAPNANVVGVDGALSVELSCGTGILRVYVRNLAGRPAQLAITAGDGTVPTTSVLRAVPTGSGAFAVVDGSLVQGTAQVANADVVATASFSASAVAGAGCDAAAQMTASQLV
jgi:hypothetical protein